MKILICYDSQTGNTAAIAKSMAEGLQGVDLITLPVKDVDPTSLNSYDDVFLGSGVYTNGAGKGLNKLVK
ncbi:MAG: flavodoxin family protein [Candidatus Helarchaeota archaeon]|nr:flavodoxin family protein [Candidatus Helarchaeota archaeon]